MVYMLLGTGFEEVEAITPLDLMRRAGISVMTVGINGKVVYGAHSIGIEADITLPELDLTDLEMIVLPGGLGGVASARASQEALNALKFAWDNGKFGGITIVDDVKTEIGEINAIYDLQGRKVTNPTNGIYIINGKKVLIK